MLTARYPPGNPRKTGIPGIRQAARSGGHEAPATAPGTVDHGAGVEYGAAMSERLTNGFLLLVGALGLGAFVNAFFAWQLLGVSLVPVLYYFGLPAALAAAGLGALRLPPPRRAFVAVNLAAALVAVAIAAAVIPRLLPDRRELAAEGGPTTGRRVPETLRLRGEGVAAYPAFSPVNVVEQPYRPVHGDLPLRPAFRVDGEPVIPLTSLPGRVTVLCRETDELVVYESDEMGFNNPPGLWDGGAMEVAVLGDSYVHGHCVPAEQSLVGRLRQRFPRTINLGVEATGPLAQLAVAREYASVLRPDVLVWAYFENDLADLEVERRVPLYRRYLEPDFSQHLLDRRDGVEAMLAAWIDGNLAERGAAPGVPGPRPGLSRRIQLAIHPAPLRAAVASLHGHAVADFETFERALARGRDDAAAWGGQVVFVYLPSWTYFHGGVGPADLYRRRNRDRVLEIVHGLGIPVVDLLPVFRAQEDPRRLSLGHNLHYSPEGYAVAAEAIADSVATLLER